MANTVKVALPLLADGQTGAEITVNSALIRLDTIAFPRVKDKDLATPPGSPSSGDMYIVAASPTAAWTGHTGDLAAWLENAWQFITVFNGMLVFVEDEALFYKRTGGAWSATGI